MQNNISRRRMMANTAAGIAAASAFTAGAAYADDPVIPAETIAARKNAPVIPKTVNKLFNNAPTIKEPNDMQFAPDGNLWLLDQVDPNKVFTVNPKDGTILAQVVTESIHGSGITYGDARLVHHLHQSARQPAIPQR